MKKCTGCGETKEDSLFHWKAYGITRTSACKTCASEKKKAKKIDYKATYKARKMSGDEETQLYNQLRGMWR